MKHVFPKITVVFPLIMALSFLIGGTASAQSATASHAATTTTSAQPRIPLCGYTQKSSWIWNGDGYGNVNIIKWENTCTSAYHCEAIDQTFYGARYHVGIWLELDAFNSSGVLQTSKHSYKYPFQENEIVDTGTISGYSSYVCTPSVHVPIMA